MTTGAGWSDSFIYPARGLAHIYDELTDEQAVMVEPTCVSIHSVLCAPPQKGEKVLVMGCGAIGSGRGAGHQDRPAGLRSLGAGARPLAAGVRQKLGADHVLSGEIYEATSKATGGSPVYTGMGGNRYFFGGFDRVYDCVGGDWSNHTAVRLLRARGTLVKIGHHMRAVTFDETPVWWQELTPRGRGRPRHGDLAGPPPLHLRSGPGMDTRWHLQGRRLRHPPFQARPVQGRLRLALQNSPEVIKIVLDCQ